MSRLATIRPAGQFMRSFDSNLQQEFTNEDLVRLAPSVGATSGSMRTSTKYKHISTLEIVDLLREDGWYPAAIQECRALSEERKGFQRHMIRFQHPDYYYNGERVESILTNSHDAGSSYQFNIGVFRLICSNGMIAGNTVGSIRIMHMGYNPIHVKEASKKLLQQADTIGDKLRLFKTIQLTQDEAKILAETTIEAVYGEPAKAPIHHTQLLTRRRAFDKADDLWTTTNVIQENVMKGGLKGKNQAGRWTSTRAVKSIDRDLKINTAIWSLAEKMAELKTAEMGY
uniref:DUF945 domain-containing protein n=1 Tax=viral metagenome TaxID=1070528 RepID=A0A6M3L5J2_9ZZZZ